MLEGSRIESQVSMKMGGSIEVKGGIICSVGDDDVICCYSLLFVLPSCQGCIHCLLPCCRGSAGTHCAQNGTETGNLGPGMASNRYPRCQRSGKEFGCPWELNGGYHAKMRQRPESGIRSSWISYQVVGKRFGSPHRASKTGTRHLWWLIEPKTGQ